MPTARWWKEFYARERFSLGVEYLESLFERAPRVPISAGAIIFPHTKLSASGSLIAAAAWAIMRSECESVLALGVLHLGGQRSDSTLRGIHGPGAPHDKGIWCDEFSLDNFEALLAIAARFAGKPMPKLIMRYPFHTGEQPESLSGFDELVALVEHGAAIVATADMVHHGAGYGTPEASRLDRDNHETILWAEREIEAQLDSLARKDFAAFLSQCETVRSDFRDVGPVLCALLPSRSQPSILDLTLVDYSDVLNSEEPTWVAAALAEYG